MKLSYCNSVTLLLGVSLLLRRPASAQNNAQPQPSAGPTTQQQSASEQPQVPKGTVLFESHGEPPLPGAAPEAGKQVRSNPVGPELTDAERNAVTITGYDLDARIAPTTSQLSMRARLTLRNDGVEPLSRVALQISSTLHWESANLSSTGSSSKLELGQHILDTDADHTGKASEAVIVLPAPLEHGKTVALDTFYSGTLPQSADRLRRIGATAEQALRADWDGIFPGHVALRGFGNVLWYPVASPQVFLGEGAQLFDAIGATELREQAAPIRLRVGMEYSGDAPAAVYFCGRRQPFKAVSDDPDAPIAMGSGIAVAEFSEQPLGFRLPSLLIVERPEQMIAPLSSAGAMAIATPAFSSSAALPAVAPPLPSLIANASGSGLPVDDSFLLAVESDDDPSLPALANSAQHVAPLLQEWLGDRPLSALTVVDQRGQPFEDGPLLLAPVASLATSAEETALAHSLTHAWVQTGRPWMDEGLAQFFALLWTERQSGREAALAQLNDVLQPLSIAEPDIEEIEEGKSAPAGQPLIAASSEVFFRRKAAAVWFMLRSLTGDKPLQAALQAWRVLPPSRATAEADALAFEALLEKTSGKDLHWLFADWVLHDRGLPDLSITDVTPRELPAGSGHGAGWLVSVTVHNSGAAAAEVPVVVRSGTFSTTSVLRVTGFRSATARVLVEAAPTEVQVNDGGTPEIGASRHVRAVGSLAK